MNYKDLADLIFPEAKDISYYEEKYPRRELKETLDDLADAENNNIISKTRPRRTRVTRNENIIPQNEYEYEYDETDEKLENRPYDE